MKNITYEEFIEKCNNFHCLRHTIVNKKTCLRDYKQENCYRKYQQKKEKEQLKFGKKDEKWEEVREKIWLRDAGYFDSNSAENINWKSYCRLWNVLTEEEKDYIETHFSADLWLNKNLDCAHVLGRNVRPDRKYDIENVYLIGRLFHSRLDQYKNPITNKPIDQKERLEFFYRIERN